LRLWIGRGSRTRLSQSPRLFGGIADGLDFLHFARFGAGFAAFVRSICLGFLGSWPFRAEDLR
jgi:hypothetical protein